jgi:hypothetical protein
MTATESNVSHRCDIANHDFDGEVFEARTGNWLVPGEMVWVMTACADHPTETAAHPRAWWVEWLRTEGAELGYSSLS